MRKRYKVLPKTHRSDYNPFKRPSVSIGGSEYLESSEAVVLDVIVNEEHDMYRDDGYNVGCVKFRPLNGGMFKDEDELQWAFPLYSNREEWPLKNEIIRIYTFLNRIYYVDKINLGNRQTQQALFSPEQEAGRIPSSAENVETLRQSTYAPLDLSDDEEPELGDYYVDREDQHRLRHWEGDIIYQGRSGQSIRLGSSFLDDEVNIGVYKSTEVDQSANIVMVAGLSDRNPTPDNEFGRIRERFNEDYTTLWMAEDSDIRVTPTSADASAYNAKSEFSEKIQRNFFAVNTGTVYINSRRHGINVSSNGNIILSGNSSYSVEVDGQIDTYSVGPTSIWSRDRVSIVAPKIYIGSRTDTSEPLVLGQSLTDLLLDIVNTLLSNASSHTLGSTGPAALNPGNVSMLARVAGQLRARQILSNDNYVNRKNESTG